MPSLHQRRARALFARSAHEERDRFGKAEIVGKDGKIKTVPKSAEAVQDNMKNMRITPEKPRKISDYVAVSLEVIKKMAEELREIQELSS